MSSQKTDGVSRRSFLGGALLVGTASAGLLAGCSPSNSNAAAESSSASAEADVIVVGSGLSAMCAALKLVDLGVKTLIVEKGESLHLDSNSTISSGMFCRPLDDSQESKDALYAAFEAKSHGEGLADITRIIVDNIGAGMDYLVSHGAEFTEPTEAPSGDHLQCFAAPGASQGMGPLLEAIGAAYHELGGEEVCGAKVIDLIIDDSGAVGGVRARTKNGIENFVSKAVVIAAGGYVANRQMLELYVGPDGDNIMMRGNKKNTGDVIQAAERAGAMLYQMGGMDAVHVGAVAPENTAAGNPYLALPFTLAINSEGNRYTDESLGYVNNGKALMNEPGQVCALIFDEAIKQVANVTTDFEKFERLEIPITQADSLAELAEKIGVPAAALEATVSAFNAASDGEKTTGLAVEKTAYAQKVEGPKYYAFYPLKPGSMMGFGGLHVDEYLQVLEADGTPIGNLFAAGECLGGVFRFDYLSGASCARCVSTGIAAAESASNRVS